MGARALGDLTYMDLAEWVTELREAMARSTADTIRKVLSMMLDDAVRDRRIPANPLSSLRRARASPTVGDERVSPTPAQAVAVAHHAYLVAGPWAHTLVLTLAWTGARWGEIAGLRPGDVDLDHRVVHLREALHEVDGHLYFAEGKTGARTVELPPFLVAELRHHLADHPGPLVFTGDRGGLLRRSNFARRVLDPAADGRKAKPAVRGRAAIAALPAVCPGLSPHGFRHGHNTWLIADGIPEVARADRLGWKLTDKIQATYSHVSADMRERVLYALQARWEDAVAEHRKDVLPGCRFG